MFKIKLEDDDGNFKGYDFNLLIINDFKNPEEIDLNESNINTIPAKILYYYRDKIIKKENNIILKNNLNNWINSPIDYNHPLSPIMKEHRKDINIFIKLSEYFSVFYIKNPFENKNDGIIFLYFFLPLSLGLSIIAFGFYNKFGGDSMLTVGFICISFFLLFHFVVFVL